MLVFCKGCTPVNHCASPYWHVSMPPAWMMIDGEEDHATVQVHDDPMTSPADAPTQWPLRHLEQLLTELIAIAKVTKGKEPFHIDLTPYNPDQS